MRSASTFILPEPLTRGGERCWVASTKYGLACLSPPETPSPEGRTHVRTYCGRLVRWTYGESLVLTPWLIKEVGELSRTHPSGQHSVSGGLVCADGTVRGSSSRYLVQFPRALPSMYAHTPSFQCNNVFVPSALALPSHHPFPKLLKRCFR